MAITSTRVTVGLTATLLVPVSNQPQQVQLLNAGDEVVRIGGPDVTTTAFGLPRLPNNPDVARTPFTFRVDPGESIWGIVAANTSSVNVWIQTP
jgi:hypothetical protein